MSSKEVSNTNYRNIVCVFIGSLMKDPNLFSVMDPVLQPNEINNHYAGGCYREVYKTMLSMFDQGVRKFTQETIAAEHKFSVQESETQGDNFIAAMAVCFETISSEEGVDSRFFLSQWQRLRKYSALDNLAKQGMDVSMYDPRLDTLGSEQQLMVGKVFEDISLENILSVYEKKLLNIKTKFETRTRTAIHADHDIFNLIGGFKENPNIGPAMCGRYLNSIIGGARPGTMFLRSAASNAGKAIPNYTKIPLYNGVWKQVGDVRPGDILIGSDGGPTEVLKIYPQEFPKEVYRVKLRDGRVAECCGEHLWQVEIDGKSLTMETRELYYYVRDSLGKESPACYLQMTKPVQYKEQTDLPFSIDEMAMKIKSGKWKIGIPSKYLRGSIEQRQALYDRLTEKNIQGNRFQVFDSEQIASDYRELCYSLGLAAKGVRSAGCYRVESWETNKLRIVSIENTELTCDMTCFTVDAVDALFCMNDYIVTHNTRLSVFDACKLAYPLHWDQRAGEFILEDHAPQKVLYITTEMSPQEIQTICVAYISGVEEQHIKRGLYQSGEEIRVQNAMRIMQAYHNYLILDSIPNPDLNNVRSVIKRHIIMENVGFVFFDYIFTSPALLAQFSSNNVREDIALAMLSNQLKEIAQEFGVFIATSTQINGDGLKLSEKRDQRVLRGSKAIADKPDTACILAKVSPEELEMIRPYVSELGAPTHVFDIYKLRSGTYKNHRVWSYIDLGTGRWKDLFVTDETNQLVRIDECSLIASPTETIIRGGQWPNFSLEGVDIEQSIYKGL